MELLLKKETANQYMNSRCDMETLNKLYRENGAYALMTITYLLDVGFQAASQITDEEIAKVKEETSPNAILSADFNEWCMQTARQLANELSPVQLMKWMQVNKPYDTKGIKKA